MNMIGQKKEIIVLPHEHLRQRSKKVGIINNNILALINNMQEALLKWEDGREHEVGVALAAVQIDEMVRVVIVRSNFEDKQNRTFETYINPEITKYDGKIEHDYEGCLSIKDVYGFVPRYTKVKVKALDVEGKIVRVNAEGFLARVFQHEIDHTNGKVFIDHIRDQKDAFFHLDSDGHLEQLDYEKDVRDSSILW